MTLSTLDFIVVALYFLLVVAHGLWVGRGERNASDYFLAGRVLPWWLIGLSLYASNMSGASFVGLIGASYEHGMRVYNYEWTATAVLIVFAFVMAPVFLRGGLYTVPEYLERRFDHRARKLFAGFTILAVMLIDTAGALYAGGLVITLVLPGLALWQASASLAVIAGVYTVFGGLKAVVVTDALQAILLIVGAGIVTVVGLETVGGWDALMSTLPARKTALIGSLEDDFLPWPGIGGVLLLGFYYWTVNQYFVQRALAARSVDDARKGALFAGLLKLPNLLLMIVPGLIAFKLFPNLSDSDLAFPKLAFEMLPEGLRGLLMTALVAAIMSSLDSALNAAASLLTMDFVRPARPGISQRSLLRVGRGFTVLLMIIAACYAPLIERFGSLFQYFQSTLAYIAPPVVAVVLGGLLSRRFTATSATYGLTIGLGGGLVFFLLNEVTGAWSAAGFPTIHFSYVAMLTFALTLSVMVVASLLGEAPPADRLLLTASVSDLTPRPAPKSIFSNYRWQAAALAALTGLSMAWVW